MKRHPEDLPKKLRELEQAPHHVCVRRRRPREDLVPDCPPLVTWLPLVGHLEVPRWAMGTARRKGVSVCLLQLTGTARWSRS